jgi:hypothetical protein
MSDKSEYSSEYPDPNNASNMSTVDLIEWIAQIAYDGKDWGWIKNELMRRFAGAETDGTVAMIAIPLETYEFFCRASGGKGEDAITNALRTLMEMFSV